MAVPTAQDYDNVCDNEALPMAKAAFVSWQDNRSTAEANAQLVKSMCMAALTTGLKRLSDENTQTALGITDAMARFWDIVGGAEESGEATLSRLSDIVIPKASREPEPLIQVPPGVAWMSAKHAVEDAETSRVEAVDEMVEAQIAECEADEAAMNREEMLHSQEASVGRLSADGNMQKVLDQEEEIEFLHECIAALKAHNEYMDEYISAEIRFWESAVAANERNVHDWYARGAEHPVMEDTAYFTQNYTEFWVTTGQTASAVGHPMPSARCRTPVSDARCRTPTVGRPSSEA
ncbi:uncharacterized protein B0H18DRAFT_959903 [Fomitopsis serialis]|uniref:uncharacterized protein n=1 Tax=Fomitopsis serialis TaxID=139415 RepID=UPI0020085465|nr:uncharacterized protein B0H18DRAFT_959903 [Neoantrodia serialis]KAH9914315.1 hypothetical protein B0H18DRAFT_959903 [Neoantrodia serialis]